MSNNSISSLYQKFQAFPQVCTDTRNIKPNAIFFALKGDNFNGNKFAKQAIEAGCSYAVIDEKEFQSDEKHILVEDVLQCLQQLANYHRKQLNIPIIGITGSNGKTTTKELVNAVLQKKNKTYSTIGNLNNHIGVPLTLLAMTDETEIGIVEMGANHQGEIKMLCEISEPNFGLITNIGKAHLEGFGGEEGIKKGKGELYDFIRKNKGELFLNEDNNLLKEMADGIKYFSYGTSETADITGKLISSNPFLNIQIINHKSQISTHLIGKYNFDNILAAVAIGSYFGVNENDIKEAIENYIPTNNRSQIIKKESNTILLDAYNANPSSMEAAINNFAEFDAENKILILGDMLELGSDAAKEHQYIVDLLVNKGFENVYLVGNNFCKSKNKFKIFETVEQCFLFFEENKIRNSTVLIKGSRGIKLEKMTNVF